MEGVPNNVESLADHIKLQKEAPAEAKRRIAETEGYDDMELQEKVQALDELIERLADEGNHNRYVAKEVAWERDSILEEIRHTERRAVLDTFKEKEAA